jgi:Spy/CpxP family protein refolding chaperone
MAHGMGHEHDTSMMALMAGSPHALLAQRAALALTSAQVTSLQALDHTATASRDSVMHAMAPLHDRMAQLVQADALDENAVRDVTDQMDALHGRMMGGMLHSIHDARAVLTSDQRRRLASLPPMPMDGGGQGCMM